MCTYIYVYVHSSLHIEKYMGRKRYMKKGEGRWLSQILFETRAFGGNRH